MSYYFKKVVGKLFQSTMPNETSVEGEGGVNVEEQQDPGPRRSTRLIIMKDGKRLLAEMELNQALEEQQATQNVEQQVEQDQAGPSEQELPSQQPLSSRKPPQKRKRQPQQDLDGDQGVRCVCTEIDGKLIKLYDLPRDV